MKMNHEDYFDFAQELFMEMLVLKKEKSHDYTCVDSPFENFEASKDFGVDPVTGLCLRMSDKFQRIKTFNKKGTLASPNEGVEDAFKDIIGYSVLALGMLKERKK